MADEQPTRREFLKKTTYAAPRVVTLPAVLSIASAGSGRGPTSGGGGSGGGCEWWEVWCWKPRMVRRLFD